MIFFLYLINTERWLISSSLEARDRRTGDSRGFAFVRYKYADEAQKAVDKLDGRNVDGRDIMVQFAKYGPNAEKIHKGRIIEKFAKTGDRSRSRSPYSRYRDDYHDRDYRRSRSRSRDRYDRVRYHGRERDSYHRSRSRILSPGYHRSRGQSRYEDEQRRSRSHPYDSASPQRGPSSRSSLPCMKPPSRGDSPDMRKHDERSSALVSDSPRTRPVDSRSPSPCNSEADD